MANGAQPRRTRSLNQLAADVARLTHTQCAMLSCGTETLAGWHLDATNKHTIATEVFNAGAETFELSLFDAQPRMLTSREAEALQAITDMFQQVLIDSPVMPHPSADPSWVVSHVESALDYVTDAFILVLRDWTIQHVNTPFERTVGRRRSELLGRSLWEAFPDAVGSRFETEMRAAAAGRVPRVYEEYSKRLDRWFESRAFPCRQGLAILTLDVTQRKHEANARMAVEEKLRQTQRMESLGTLATGIAHDFNNILAVILGHAGLMHDALPCDSVASENLKQIRVAGERARGLVHQILTFSRAANRELTRQPLRPLIEESIQLMRATLPASVRLRQSLTEEPLETTVNPTEVQQLMMNFCTNAWQALPSDGGDVQVELSATEVTEPIVGDVGQATPGLHARIVVSDNGSGIEAGIRERLFEPFFTTKPRGHGTGLGLYVLGSIVMAHGGAIEVKSALGQGSQFTVYLPATSTVPAATVETPMGAMARVHDQRVAYVDDDAVVQLTLQLLLERAGFTVASFSDPAELLAAAAREPRCFDLLVTDYSMPGMNGLEVTRRMRQLCPGIPVIIVTGLVSDELLSEVSRLDHAEVLRKEHTFDELGDRAVRAVGITATANSKPTDTDRWAKRH